MGIQDDYIMKLASEGKRLDRRNPEDFRRMEIEKGVIENAEGSARVKLGDTEVMVGVKLNVGEPFSDKPEDGVLMVSAELSPIASPDFEPGPPREESIELARVVDRGIREAGAIDTKNLCITPREKVWIVCVDLQVMNHDGNLIDACSIAAIAALLSARMPAYDGNAVDYKKREAPLPVKSRPIAVTVNKMDGGKLFVDTTLEEEGAVLSRLTVTTTEEGNVTALQKGGEPLTLDEVMGAIDISMRKGSEIRKLVEA